MADIPQLPPVLLVLRSLTSLRGFASMQLDQHRVGSMGVDEEVISDECQTSSAADSFPYSLSEIPHAFTRGTRA